MHSGCEAGQLLEWAVGRIPTVIGVIAGGIHQIWDSFRQKPPPLPNQTFVFNVTINGDGNEFGARDWTIERFAAEPKP